MSQNQIKTLLIVIFQCSITILIYLIIVLILTAFNFNCFAEFTLIQWLMFTFGLIPATILGFADYRNEELNFHQFKNN